MVPLTTGRTCYVKSFAQRPNLGIRAQCNYKTQTNLVIMAYELPPLPYPKNALEPHIDALTMEIHHDKHHGAYVTNVNKAIAGKADLEKKSVEDLIRNIDAVPADV